MKIAFSPKNFYAKLFLCFLFIKLCHPLEIILARYDSSNSSLNALNDKSIQEIYLSFPSIEWHECNISTIKDCILAHTESSVLIDISKATYIQFKISQICKELSLVHLVYQDKFYFEDEWTYSLIPQKNKQLDALLALLNHFNWAQGIFICDHKKSEWRDNIVGFSSEFEWLTVESETSIEELVNGVIFQLGSTLYYVLTGTSESTQILNSLSSKKLLSSGNGIVFIQEGGYDVHYNGALILTEIGQELTLSVEDYFKNSAIRVIDILERNEFIDDFKQLFYAKIIEYYNKGQFSIINIQNGIRKTVGSINSGNVTIFGDLIFPGQSSIIPKSTKKILQLSISAGTTNPGTSASPIAAVGARGSFAVKDLINEGNDILSHFYLKIISFDCGVTVFNASFAESCFRKSIDQLGLSHISAFSSTITIGSIQIFKTLNITVPVIGATNADDSLSSIVNFPTYSRVQMAYSFICPKFSIIIKGLGWASAVVLYQNDAWGLAAYSYIKKNSEILRLKLVNPEKLRPIPAGLSKSGLKNYTNSLQEIIDSQVRLFLLIIQYPLGNYILEELYDLGARKGDFVICAGYQDLPTLISINDTNLYKRLETGIPMFTLVSEYWAGSLGQDALKRIRSAYYSEPSAFSCFYVDAAYLIASALDYMINRGHDYSSPDNLMAAIRSTQFHGCTGRVGIEKGSNDRIVDRMIIEGVKLAADGSTSIYTIGNFRPFSSQVISIINPIIYADGSTQKPSEYRNINYRCPFPDKKMKTFEKGRGLLFGICFASALIMIIITFYIWKKWWNISVDPLKQKEEISIQDAIVAASIGIEFFQYASMGPDFKLISPFLSELSGLFSLNLEDVIKLENGVFWVVVDVVYGGIGLWILLCMVILLQLDEKFPYVSLFRFLRWLSDFLMPILGNLCFIPFISICLDIFQCDTSIGDNFTDSILAKDCYYFCWKDEHLVYAIISFFALLFYEPLAIFCRPLWQELQPTLHVKTVPLFLMVKTVVQTSLIVLNGTVKRSCDIAHAVIFIIFMTFYAVFIFKFKPYNYSRFSWWQGLSVIGVIWLALLSLPGYITNNQNLAISLFAILLSGWGIIILFGLYIQIKRLPCMLYRKKGHDTSTLFKFAFTFGKSSKISLGKLQQTIKV